MKVKICGLTRKNDLDLSLKSGADLVGFINIKRSKRYLKIGKIRKLTADLTDKKKAVLVTEPLNVEEVMENIKTTGFSNIQLHSLSPSQISQLKENNDLMIIRAVGVSPEFDDHQREEIENFAKICDYLLLDYQVNGKTGGTGKQIPLNIAIEALKHAKKVNSHIKVILAGGMDCERLEREGVIIKKYFDYVDVNSGIEDYPGIKNSYKLVEFLDKRKVISND